MPLGQAMSGATPLLLGHVISAISAAQVFVVSATSRLQLVLSSGHDGLYSVNFGPK